MKGYHVVHSWEQAVLLFHTLPRLGEEGLILAWSEQPLFCLGVHQEVRRVVERTACPEHNVGLMRRECGGGLFPLGRGTLLYQVVVRRGRIQGVSRRAVLDFLLHPLLETCRALGVEVVQGAFGHYLAGERQLFQASLMELPDFVGVMAPIQLHPLSPQMVALAHQDFSSLSFVELGIEANRRILARYLYAEAMHLFEPLATASISEAVQREMNSLAVRMLSPAWVVDGGRGYRRRSPLAHTGVLPRLGSCATPVGMIYASSQFDEDLQRLLSVAFDGDFFVFPPDGLSWIENALENCPRHEVEAAIRRVYRFMPLETPEIAPQDWIMALNLPPSF